MKKEKRKGKIPFMLEMEALLPIKKNQRPTIFLINNISRKVTSRAKM